MNAYTPIFSKQLPNSTQHACKMVTAATTRTTNEKKTLNF